MSRRYQIQRGIGRAAVLGVAGIALAAFGRPADAQELDFEFYRDNIEPMFYRLRGTFQPPDPGDPACVMCHTWQANTPMMLQSLEENTDGSVYWTEAQSRQNFLLGECRFQEHRLSELRDPHVLRQEQQDASIVRRQ